MGIGSTIGQVAQPTQSAPQPMGGKGGVVSRLGASAGNALGKTYGAQEPIFAQPATPQPMGGKGGFNPMQQTNVPSPVPGYNNYNDYMTAFMEKSRINSMTPGAAQVSPMQPPMIQNTGGPMTGIPSGVSFMSPRGATTGGPRTLPASQQPQFDDRTTQADFDRARGITPAVMPSPDMQRQYAQAGEDYRNVTQDQISARQQYGRMQDQMAQQRMMQHDLTGQQAIEQQRMMQAIQQQRMMQQPQFMGGKGGFGGGRFNPYAGSFGGGFNPYVGGYGGGFGGGLGGLAALMQSRGAMYNKGGEVK